MTLKIAINGFGRIGRGVLRALLEGGEQDIDVVAINDLAPPATLAHLLKYDSVHGRLKNPVTLNEDSLTVGGQTIRLTAMRDPKELPWSDVDIAFECTGHFTSRAAAAAHLLNGSKRFCFRRPARRWIAPWFTASTTQSSPLKI